MPVGSIGTALFGDNVTLSPGIPTHSSGERLWAVGFFRNKAAGDGETIAETGPGAWTQVADELGIGLFTLLATSSSETVPTLTFSGGSSGDSTGAVVFITTGVSATVEDSASLDNSSSTDVDFSALTIAQSCLVLDLACVNDNTNFNNTAGWTELLDDGTVLGTDIQIAIQHQTTGSNTSAHVGTIGLANSSQTLSIALQEESGNSAILRRRR